MLSENQDTQNTIYENKFDSKEIENFINTIAVNNKGKMRDLLINPCIHLRNYDLNNDNLVMLSQRGKFCFFYAIVKSRV